MAASFVVSLFTQVGNTTNSTTMTATTAVTVAAGDSAIIEASARGGTTTAQSCSLSGLPGDAVVETSPDISNGGSPAVQMFRVYFPSGMASGTVITFTWTQAATRKAAAGQVVTGLANSNGIWQTSPNATSATLAAGTTAATTTTDGWHAAAWGYNSTSGTITGTPGSDVGGTMTERADKVSGTSSFHYLYAEDRPVSASTSGETATATLTAAPASSVGVQGVWDGAAAGTAYTDSGTISTTPSLSGVDAAGSVDAATLTVTPVLSSTNTAGSVDSGTLTITPAFSSVDAVGNTDAGTLTITPVLSGVGAAGNVDSGTLSITPVLSATEIYTPAGAGGIAYTDAGTLTAAFAFSGADSIGSVDSGTLAAAFALSAATSVGYSDAATLTTTFALSATTTTGYADTGTLTLAFVLAASTSTGAVDTASLTVGFVLAATEVYSSASAASPSRTRTTASAGPTGRGRAIGIGFTVSTGSMARTSTQRRRHTNTRVATLGYSNQVLGGVDPLIVETLIGRTFTGLRQNQAYTVTGWATAATEYDAGRTLAYRSIQFDALAGGWAAAATGAADATILTTMANLRATGRWNAQNPALICLHHEATVSPFGTTGFTATNYINMWQHIVPLLDTNGYTVHDRFGVYNPNGVVELAYVGWDRMFVGANGVGGPTAGQGVNDLDPDTGLPTGQSLYRYLGSDIYNNLDAPGVLRYGTDALTLLAPLVAAAVARNKDFIIGEMGCPDGATTQDHQNKAAWIDSLRVGLIARGSSKPGVCRALLTTIKSSSELFNVDSSAESLAAYQRLGASTYFK